MERAEIIEQLRELVKEYYIFFGGYACLCAVNNCSIKEAKSNPALEKQSVITHALEEAIKILEQGVKEN